MQFYNNQTRSAAEDFLGSSIELLDGAASYSVSYTAVTITTYFFVILQLGGDDLYLFVMCRFWSTLVLHLYLFLMFLLLVVLFGAAATCLFFLSSSGWCCGWLVFLD